MQDVGKPKAVVAAERINKRVQGVNVTPHYCRIDDMPAEFYQEFTVIILGLDSLEARRWMNSMACSLLGGQLHTGLQYICTVKRAWCDLALQTGPSSCTAAIDKGITVVFIAAQC